MGTRKTDPLQGLRTWNGNNDSVVWAGFGVQFDAMPAPETLESLSDLHERVKSEYPRLRVKSAGEGSQGSAEDSQMRGFLFSQPDAKQGSVRQVCFEDMEKGPSKSSLMIRRDDYSSWENTWEREASGIFGLMLPVLLKEVGMTEVELIMSRRFVWDRRPDRSWLARTFRKGSPLVPSALLEEEAGAYSELVYMNSVQDNAGRDWMMAHNVKIELIHDAPVEKWGEEWIDIHIYQTLLVSLSSEGHPKMPPPGASASPRHIKRRLNHYMGTLRQENLRALSNILSETACRKLGVQGRNGNAVR